jgi:cytochrome c oxidase accessory protein FixG
MSLNDPNLDSVTTINNDGSRPTLHPADVRGRFTLARRIFAVILIAIYLLLPWIEINGFPAVFFDLTERRIHLLGITFAYQDLWLGFFFLTGLGFTGFFLTALFGRIWCGWACPHTVFLEHVYRRIERWIEGPAPERRRLESAPWDTDKTLKRIAKHSLFLGISALIAHFFLAYFVSLSRLYAMMLHSPLENWGPFLFVLVATLLIYFNFAWFREQLCIVICPYGRLQSSLIDDDTMVIGYDTKRGEPRGKVGTPHAGDCIDCHRCIHVCPTGIDIRQGLQLECVGCSNCIDACDEVMAKLNRPLGLVRYDSLNGLAGKPRHFLRPRLVAYLTLMAIGAALAALAIFQLRPANLSVLRMQGAPYFVSEEEVRNQFLVRIINKQSDSATFTLLASAQDQEGLHWVGFDQPTTLAPMEEIVRPLVLQLPRSQYRGHFRATVKVQANPGNFSLERSVEFLGPDPRLLREEEEERRRGPHPDAPPEPIPSVRATPR